MLLWNLFTHLLKWKKYILDINDAKLSLFEYIEGFYNRNRIQSAINFLSPIQFEKLLLAC